VIVFPETGGRMKFSQGGPAVDVRRIEE
jgi:hypothetical protein